jgi:hypothetical protein
MDDHSVALRYTGAHLGADAVVVSDFDFLQAGFAFFNHECHPIITAPKKGAGWYLRNIVTVPCNDTRLHPIAITEFPAGRCLIEKIHPHFYALFFDSERRDFREGPWLNQIDPSAQGRVAAPGQRLRMSGN